MGGTPLSVTADYDVECCCCLAGDCNYVYGIVSALMCTRIRKVVSDWPDVLHLCRPSNIPVVHSPIRYEAIIIFGCHGNGNGVFVSA